MSEEDYNPVDNPDMEMSNMSSYIEENFPTNRTSSKLSPSVFIQLRFDKEINRFTLTKV